MLLLTVHRPDVSKMAAMLEEIDRATKYAVGGPQIFYVHCYVRGEYAYCFDNPTWVAALVQYGAPVEIKDYPLDTDWQDVYVVGDSGFFGSLNRDGDATVRDMVAYAYGHLLGWGEGYHPFRGECYYVTDTPKVGCVYCINYDEVRDIARQRALATDEEEQEQQEQK